MKSVKRTYFGLINALERHEGMRFFFGIVANGVVILAFYHLLAFLIISLAPVSHYFHYYSVEPIKTVFERGEKLVIISNAEYHKPVFINWNDILRCPLEGFYSQNITNAHKEKGVIKNGTWTYHAPLPTSLEPSECIIESQITATVGYGIKKTQTIKSQPFIIK